MLYISNIKLFLCLFSWAPLYIHVRRSGSTDPHTLNLGANSTWVVSVTPQYLHLWGRSPWIFWMGSWEGFRRILNIVKKRKFSYPYRESIPNSSASRIIARRLVGVSINREVETRHMAWTAIKRRRPSGQDMSRLYRLWWTPKYIINLSFTSYDSNLDILNIVAH